MSNPNYSPEETAERGEAIYEKSIRGRVENTNKGDYVVMDIESGEYEVDQEDLVATTRMLARHPNAVLYGLRIGYPAAYRLGGFSKAIADD